MQGPCDEVLTQELHAALTGLPRPRAPPSDAVVGPRLYLRAEDVVCPPGVTLALLVPFREDFSGRRTPQLFQLLRHLDRVFLPRLPSGYRAVVLVLEQSPSGPFNKGMLLNAGARWCSTHIRSPVVLVLQDVDMLPRPELMPFYCHYRLGDVVHPGWINRKYDYEDYFGSVCTITLSDYLASGGFPNEFWGWGLEDDCIYWRLRFCAGCQILKPAASTGLEHLDDPAQWIDGPGVEHNQLPHLGPEHMLALRDTIFDSARFRVLRYGQAGELHHLLLEFRRNGLLEEDSGTPPGNGSDGPLCRHGVLEWLAGLTPDGVEEFEALD